MDKKAPDSQATPTYREGGIKALLEVPGVGTAIARKIEEYINTGKISKYEEYKEKIPIDFKNLGIKGIEDLKKAVEKHEIRNPRIWRKD